ncbi:Clustered mitochondria protein isoform C [Glycine soja]|uniref:Clustered mitochondria protein isoform C n=1 Tax=Glycine soja TaxID=3848 RepID=A0A445I135_GLYSO|nr:Clustered mitochondria protein isoform C [Glycine soja]
MFRGIVWQQILFPYNVERSTICTIARIIYFVGMSDSDEHLERKILDPERLSRVESIFGNLSETIKIYGPWSSAWVGEAGGAYNSGGNHVSNRFLNSFCAVLWHRLMGKKVLTVSSDVHIKDFYLQLGNKLSLLVPSDSSLHRQSNPSFSDAIEAVTCHHLL